MDVIAVVTHRSSVGHWGVVEMVPWLYVVKFNRSYTLVSKPNKMRKRLIFKGDDVKMWATIFSAVLGWRRGFLGWWLQETGKCKLLSARVDDGLNHSENTSEALYKTQPLIFWHCPPLKLNRTPMTLNFTFSGLFHLSVCVTLHFFIQ